MEPLRKICNSLFAILFIGISAQASVFTPTAFRIDGTTATTSSTCNTASACNGWVLEVDVPTIGTTGSFTLGLGTNNDPKNAAIILTVTSSGYQSPVLGGTCGSTTTYTRTLYATHILREPTPNQATNDVTNSAGTTTFRFALGGGKGPIGSLIGPGWVFSSDTVTVQVASSFFTDGSSNTVGTVTAGTSVTNNSTLAYSAVRAIGNWSRVVQFQHITGSTVPLAVVAFSQFGNNARSVACVQIKTTDGTTANTVSLGTPTVDHNQGDKGGAVTEYVANVPTTGQTNHSQLTCTFKIFPWIGDSTAVLDSSDAVNTVPTPLYAPAYVYLDNTNNSTAAAYVDGSFTMSGSHTSGTFVAGEVVTQQTSGATAHLIDVAGANGAGPAHIGAVLSGTWSTTTGLTLTGGTSGAVFTQTTTQTFAGSDSNSCAAAESGGQPGTACRTIGGAAIKMAAFNNASSTPTHNDACGTIYLEKGYYNWLGSASTVGNTSAKCWANIVPASGASQANVTMQGVLTGSGASAGSGGMGGTACTNATGLTNCGTPIHLKNVTVNITSGPTSVFNQAAYTWFDTVAFTACTGTACFYTVTDFYFTNCTFAAQPANGLQPFGGSGASFALFRGNNFNNITAQIQIFTELSNTTTTAQDTSLADNISGQTVTPNMVIVAYDNFFKWQDGGTNTLLGFFGSSSNIIGAAFIQNICENITASDNSPSMFGLAADNSSGTPVNNVMLWQNIVVGARNNRSYNDSGSAIKLRQTWSEIGEIPDDTAIKTDTFTTANAARVGNWADIYGTGYRSSVYASTAYSSVAGSFCNEFYGLFVNAPTVTAGSTQPPTCTTNANANYPQYVNRQASTGSGGTGGGNYMLKSNSPAVNMFQATGQVIAYDANGQIRNNSGWGSSGAFEQAIILTPAVGWW